MQIRKPKFRQSSIVFKKPGNLPENLKTLTSSNNHKIDYFLLNFLTHSTSSLEQPLFPFPLIA